ncbi:hypothetical protein [Gimesia maris]|uniref:hypothetical protein n=1 Tax=Gimesia maris TaxID=122 RepID=UPI00241E3853|nr:hypothetical protein [Gimesia maris]|tara:strand:+ start:5128 stop:5418 length:291 start_codon:yes stop_codon:yes gene_type:complete
MHKHRDASQRLTIEFFDIEANLYPQVTQIVVDQFQLQPVGELVTGPEERFQEFQHLRKVVGLEWDFWSGYCVVAKTKSAEKLVRKIATFIEARFQR